MFVSQSTDKRFDDKGANGCRHLYQRNENLFTDLNI